MDEHTEIFVALGAATAANCVPCFEHYFSKAEQSGIGKDEIQKAVDIAVKVRGGAHMVMKGAIEKTMRPSTTTTGKGCCGDTSACCS